MEEGGGGSKGGTQIYTNIYLYSSELLYLQLLTGNRLYRVQVQVGINRCNIEAFIRLLLSTSDSVRHWYFMTILTIVFCEFSAYNYTLLLKCSYFRDLSVNITCTLGAYY